MKSKVIEKLFRYIVTYSYLVLPLIYLFSKSKQKESHLIGLYGLIFFLLLYFYYDIPRDYNQLYNALFTFLEYTFFASIFYLNIENKRFKKLLLFCSLGFYAFLLIHYFTVYHSRIDAIPIGIESILIFVYICLFFSERMKSSRQDFIYNHPVFWISVGILVYLGGTFFINIMANTLPSDELLKYWYFNFVADTVKTCFFAISLIFYTRVSKRKEHNKQGSVPFLDMI
jgi:hypothetical protein